MGCLNSSVLISTVMTSESKVDKAAITAVQAAKNDGDEFLQNRPISIETKDSPVLQ